jgi:hypothetical protein
MHVLIQTLIISRTFINYLNKYCESETVELRSKKRNNSDRLFSTKRFGINIRSVPIPHSLSPYPPLPSTLPSPDLLTNAILLAYRIFSRVEDNGIKAKEYDLSSKIDLRSLRDKVARRGRKLQS